MQATTLDCTFVYVGAEKAKHHYSLQTFSLLEHRVCGCFKHQRNPPVSFANFSPNLHRDPKNTYSHILAVKLGRMGKQARSDVT